jgi:hypothetical protein
MLVLSFRENHLQHELSSVGSRNIRFDQWLKHSFSETRLLET